MRHERMSTAEFKALCQLPIQRITKSIRLSATKRSVPRIKGEMNKTEQRYAHQLDVEKAEGLIDGYEFEPVTFHLKGKKQTYMVDFMVWKQKTVWFVEIKIGWKSKHSGRYYPGFRPDAWEKLKQTVGEFPMLTFRCMWWHPGEQVWKEQTL